MGIWIGRVDQNWFSWVLFLSITDHVFKLKGNPLTETDRWKVLIFSPKGLEISAPICVPKLVLLNHFINYNGINNSILLVLPSPSDREWRYTSHFFGCFSRVSKNQFRSNSGEKKLTVVSKFIRNLKSTFEAILSIK